jgi:hypothetical protein
VTPAPTSVTVIIGYTHPFQTRSFNTAVETISPGLPNPMARLECRRPPVRNGTDQRGPSAQGRA